MSKVQETRLHLDDGSCVVNLIQVPGAGYEIHVRRPGAGWSVESIELSWDEAKLKFLQMVVMHLAHLTE